MLSRGKTFYLSIVLSALMVGCNGSYSSGDRVLVSKFDYDAGVGHPHRFDVVVFSFPETPVENSVPKNYIKRLLGLPGQLLAIFFGQIFCFEPAEGSPPFFNDSEGGDPGMLIRDSDGGVKIISLVKDGPAEKAGMAEDDLIIQAGTHAVADAESFREAMWASKPGEEITIKVQRGLQFQDFKMVLGCVNPNNLWEKAYMHEKDPKSLKLWEKPGMFQIVRKPPEVMLAMRRIVDDHDFPADDLPPRWLAKGDWKADTEHGFDHAGAKNDGIDWIHYEHILFPWPDENHPPRKELIRDFMGYNSQIPNPQDGDRTGRSIERNANWVGSLMIECQVNVTQAQGEFWLELNKGVNRFQACFDLGNGQCTLFKVALDDTKTELGKAGTRVKGPGKYSVRLANFDARLTLWVDDDLPFGNGVEYPPPEVRGKGEESLTKKELQDRSGPRDGDLKPASIGSKNAGIHVQSIRLWRDTYYTTGLNGPDKYIDDWADPTAWTTLRDMPVTIMYVQPGHYLCLGDNSPASSDSRYWGLVPKRLMLGRALMVYWPHDRAGPIK